jgi:hypothetical protein
VRLVPVVVVLVACGRIGFDASSSGEFVRAAANQCLPPAATCSAISLRPSGPVGDVVLVTVTYDAAAANVAAMSDGSSATYGACWDRSRGRIRSRSPSCGRRR